MKQPALTKTVSDEPFKSNFCEKGSNKIFSKFFPDKVPALTKMVSEQGAIYKLEEIVNSFFCRRFHIKLSVQTIYLNPFRWIFLLTKTRVNLTSLQLNLSCIH